MGRQRNTEMPNLFIIGAAKCGTTSLHYYLDLHPEISMSSIKEPLYFLPEEFRASWRHSPVVMSREEYLDLFEAGTTVRGEASTPYSWYPRFRDIPARMYSASPEAKLIYLVKDPVERIPAMWVQWMGGREAFHRGETGPKSLSESIGELEDPGNIYTWPGMYMTQIRRYLDHFRPESILVIDSDELRSDRSQVLAAVFEFLEVEPGFTHPSFSEERNTISSKKVESGTYIRLTRSNALRKVVDLAPARLRESMIEAVRRPLLVPAEKPQIEPELRRRLEDLYRPEVEELREFTGKPFPRWSI